MERENIFPNPLTTMMSHYWDIKGQSRARILQVLMLQEDYQSRRHCPAGYCHRILFSYGNGS